MSRARLVTIKFSHYNEAARWALDLQRVPYEELRTLPGLHVPLVLWTARGGGAADRVSSRFSTPCLVPRGDPPVHGSREIVQYADEHREQGYEPLVPASGRQREEVLAQMAHYHDKIGPNSRRWAYGFVLDDEALFCRLVAENAPPLQSRVATAANRRIRQFISKGLAVTPDRVAKSLDHLRREVDLASKALERSHFLAGDHFTAADLYFASMMAPALLVQPSEGYGGLLPAVADAPFTYQNLVGEFRSSPAGRHALRMFSSFRKPPHAKAAASLHGEHPL